MLSSIRKKKKKENEEGLKKNFYGMAIRFIV